jgi:hypothetical protein
LNNGAHTIIEVLLEGIVELLIHIDGHLRVHGVGELAEAKNLLLEKLTLGLHMSP